MPESGVEVETALGLTKVLALELGEHNILVSSVAPGEISTPMPGMDEFSAYHEDRPGVLDMSTRSPR
jgi:NAD(P)-dependent dehydrogenase (short-subunit alcohol dehydrogenase family)